MTINDLHCDFCGQIMSGPAEGVRFTYHPGVPELRDDSNLACLRCWESAEQDLAAAVPGECARCGTPVHRRASLHLRRYRQSGSWQLCAEHAVSFLNALRTVEPKLDVRTFRFPAATREPAAGETDTQPASDT